MAYMVCQQKTGQQSINVYRYIVIILESLKLDQLQYLNFITPSLKLSRIDCLLAIRIKNRKQQ